MKRKFLLFFVLLSSIFAFNILEKESEHVDYQLVEIPSPSLKNAIINPRETYKIGINLPPLYNSSNKRYPVVYYLNGYTVHAGEYPIYKLLDSVMVNSLIKDMIVVELTGHNMFQGTMYTNSPITGDWEDFVTKDVIKYIDENYRSIAKRESRGIAGHSMGGGGCTNISLKHADKYAVAYPMSPAIGEGKSAIVDLMFANDSTMMLLEDLAFKMAKVKNKDFQKEITKAIDTSDYGVTWLLGYGMAFAPDISQPLKMKLPFDKKEDGSYEINKENFALWENGFGALETKVIKYKSNLIQYKHYSIDCGYNDNLEFIKDGTAYYISLLSKNKIPHSSHWYDGDHVNRVGEQLAGRVLPIMSAYLESE